MAKRVHLSSEERREQILHGALKVFSVKGFDAATTKEIAHAAGISSTGLIYHYFDDKAALLRAVIEAKIKGSRIEDFTRTFLDLPLREGLRLFVHHYLNEISDPDTVAFVRVLVGEAMRRPEFAAVFSEAMVSQGFSLVEAFFRHHQEQGNIRPIDPTITTLRFVGSLTSVFLMREVLQLPALQSLDPSQIERTLVEDFLQGILP